jgi:hypothetical protein
MHTDDMRPGFTTAGRFAFQGGGDVNSRQISLELDELAERVSRIRPPSSRNPHLFHEDRSEVAHDIRKVAEWLRTGLRPAD